MHDNYIVAAFGPPIANMKNADLCDVTFSLQILRAVVCLEEDESGEDRYLEVAFKNARGFRYLDEGDLLPYWRSGAFDNTQHLVHEISHGGWAEQEERNGFLNTTAALGLPREWIVVSSNGCLNVISTAEPIVRLL
jgi:hypothetical protein